MTSPVERTPGAGGCAGISGTPLLDYLMDRVVTDWYPKDRTKFRATKSHALAWHFRRRRWTHQDPRDTL